MYHLYRYQTKNDSILFNFDFISWIRKIIKKKIDYFQQLIDEEEDLWHRAFF
jgi:hypothetical protein